jgi:peptide subunit release factor 1 (eRF1)
MSAVISDVLKPIRERVETKERAVQKSVRGDIDRIRQLSAELDADPAPAFAVFASVADDIFVVEALTHHVTSTATVGIEPYMRPLRAAPRPLRGGVFVADTANARVFVAIGELIEEIGEPLTAEIGKTNYGGFSGYSEYTARTHASEETTKMWRDAGSRLLEVHLERPLDYMAIGSAEEMVEEIGRELHPYLENLYRSSFIGHPQTLTLTMLRAELAALSAEVRSNRQAALAGRVCDTSWSGGLAVLGLGSILEYANAQAIDTLVVAGTFSRSGLTCPSCGHLVRSGKLCPVCQTSLVEVDDVVAAAMESVLDSGGRVVQVDVDSPLDVHGVGALTRFRIGG